MTYAEKLRDPRWQKKRLEILQRDGWACQKCFDTQTELQVHHRRYLPKCEPWDVPNSALVTLCAPCHEDEKQFLADAKRALSETLFDRYFANELFMLADGFALLKTGLPPDLEAKVLHTTFIAPDLSGKMIAAHQAAMGEAP